MCENSVVYMCRQAVLCTQAEVNACDCLVDRSSSSSKPEGVSQCHVACTCGSAPRVQEARSNSLQIQETPYTVCVDAHMIAQL